MKELNKAAQEVQDLLIGKDNKKLISYLDEGGYIYTDIEHLGIYDIARIVVRVAENFTACPPYYSNNILICTMHTLIDNDIVQIQ